MEVISRGERLEYRYELVDGLIDCSFAAYTAAQVGLPLSVANRAADVSVSLLVTLSRLCRRSSKKR